MNDLFYGYLTEAEKEFMAIESAFNIELEKQLLAYEYASKIQDIKNMQSDLRVLTESGTYEDIENLYMEAGEEAEEKKKGIIRKIIDGISNLISNIIGAIGKLFKGKKDNEVEDALKKANGKTIKVKDPSKISKLFNKASGDIQRIVRPDAEITVESAKKVGGIIAAFTAGVAAIGAVTISMAKYWKDHKTLKGSFTAFKGWVDGLKNRPPKGDGSSKVMSQLGAIVNGVGGFFKETVPTFFSNLFGGKKKEEDVNNINDQVDNTETGTKPSDGNNTTPPKTQTTNLQDAQDEETYDSANDFIDGDGFLEYDELSGTMDELADLFNDL